MDPRMMMDMEQMDGFKWKDYIADPASTEKNFHWADYLVFGLSLAISLAIGCFLGVVSIVRTSSSTEEILLGNRNIHWLPSALSLIVSVLNAGFVIGIPAEIYYFGSYYIFVAISAVIMLVVVGVFYVPVFHGMRVTSAYEVINLLWFVIQATCHDIT